MSVSVSDYFNRWLRARIWWAMSEHFIYRSGQVECPTPHHPRWDGEPCGSCRAQV